MCHREEEDARLAAELQQRLSASSSREQSATLTDWELARRLQQEFEGNRGGSRAIDEDERLARMLQAQEERQLATAIARQRPTPKK